MLKKLLNRIVVFICLFSSFKSFCQTTQTLQQIENLLDDAVFFQINTLHQQQMLLYIKLHQTGLIRQKRKSFGM